MRQRGFELVIFDCDGVLVDSEPIANRVLVDELRIAGLMIEESEAQAMFTGLSLARVLELAEARLGRGLPTEFLGRLQARTFAKFRSELRPIPGVRRLLGALEIPHCVASSGGQDKIRFTLGLTGLLECFEGRIFSATEVARGKPAPDLFLRAAEACGTDPASCAVIEDSLPGVLAGKAAGMTVFRYTPGDAGSSPSAAGAFDFESMDLLLELLNSGPPS